jgi:adenosine kinase
MSPPIIICGSIAFDTISVFPGRFADHILADRVHMLNVSFLVPTMRREFGGCAGNIAYALRLLGGTPCIVGAVGEDAAPYLERLQMLGIATDHILRAQGQLTPQAYIITDESNNQITSFHPGAMACAHQARLPDVGARLAILAPDGKEATLVHAEQARAAGLSIVFDPGQGLPMFDRQELQTLIGLSDYVVVNDYEAELLSEKLGQHATSWAEGRRGVIVTRGENGCHVFDGSNWTHLAGEHARSVIDPTGCGDAFRGALLWAMQQGFGLSDAARIGNRAGAIKVAHQGAQNYTMSAADMQL